MFYVKSTFGKFKLSKKVIFANFRGSELWIFSKFEHFSSAKFTKIQSSESLKLPKWHFWAVYICQNLISRKIRVTVRLSFNIHSQALCKFTFWKFLEHSAPCTNLVNFLLIGGCGFDPKCNSRSWNSSWRMSAPIPKRTLELSARCLHERSASLQFPKFAIIRQWQSGDQW